ncbi:MAG TPA: hypothetical protein PLN48_10640 [Lachnospiraceae bacterium]|nr:hypothetical protein [Lachnospiraceae bacterium]
MKEKRKPEEILYGIIVLVLCTLIILLFFLRIFSLTNSEILPEVILDLGLLLNVLLTVYLLTHGRKIGYFFLAASAVFGVLTAISFLGIAG